MIKATVIQNVKLVWATPNIDETLAYIARVSNPDNQDNPNIKGLLKYMLDHGHVSPFEMANVTLEITTTRDIGRQILRHRSFSFQEFSQRYQDVTKVSELVGRDSRLQDTKNRQSSLVCSDPVVNQWWYDTTNKYAETATSIYKEALEKGIAKEQARSVLPEGMTVSKMYMNGTIRSWIFYLTQRLDPSTQLEHREIAIKVLEELRKVAPVSMEAVFPLIPISSL